MLLVGLTLLGALGLMVTGEDGFFRSLYLSVVILTTVGMEAPTSDAQRVWAMLLMVGGVGVVLFASGQMVSFVVEGNLKKLIGRRKVTERIRKLNGHFIVAGFGRMGQALCGTLTYRDQPFVLIESDHGRLRDAEELGYLCIEGNAMHDAILEEAGVSRARALVTCLSQDADNVLITLTARGLKPELSITARCDESETEPKLRRAGADRVICPAVIGASRVSDQLLNPSVDDVLELDGHWPDLELSRVSLARFPGFTACTLGEVQQMIGAKVIVAALVRCDGTRIIHPGAEEVVHPDDQLVLIGGTGYVHRMVDVLSTSAAA
jgi:voltage-gated potassium channel